jgi:predicted ester cyclase
MTFSGTHQGDFMGIPASGNHVAWDVIEILQFRDDQVIARWGVMDIAGAMAQTGAPPS